MAKQQLALALDQNFPPLIMEAAPFLPEVTVAPIRQIDRRLSTLGDRELMIALY
ncbi:MAG TPA: hypothetical protein VLJ59_05160 [Mycobacteriales bacterium]|nr:hypothetical protein [Mycobacteriales bacterium]